MSKQNKRISKKQVNSFPIILGVIGVAITPLIYQGVIFFIKANCTQSPYVGCTFHSFLLDAILVYSITWGWFFVFLIILIVGLIKSFLYRRLTK